MNRIGWNLFCGSFVAVALVLAHAPHYAVAQFIPDKLFVIPYNLEGVPGSTLNVTDASGVPALVSPGTFYPLDPIPSQFVVAESNMSAAVSGFNRNEHLARFAKSSDPPSQGSGHKFQRSEAFDIAFDLKIETTKPTPRKEAGLYFESSNGNAEFVVTSNAGHYTPGPGDIATVFDRVIPTDSFSDTSGPLGDYTLNGAVDAADYTIWRETLGSTTDFRANGDNEGDSKDKIDEADYAVWKKNFGLSSNAAGATYQVGDTIRVRNIYTPPVIDPLIPFNIIDPGANVITPGRMEYQIQINGGAVISSGPLDFTYAEDAPASIQWKGIPNNTLISLRSQNLSNATAAPDGATATFWNFDFNGPAPGIGSLASVPEPATCSLVLLGIAFLGGARRRS